VAEALITCPVQFLHFFILVCTSTMVMGSPQRNETKVSASRSLFQTLAEIAGTIKKKTTDSKIHFSLSRN